MTINWEDKKQELLAKLLQQKHLELSDMQSSLEEMRKVAIDAPGRMESRYDSTKQEYNYLTNDALSAVERTNSEIKTLEQLIKDPSAFNVISYQLDGQDKTCMLLSFGNGINIEDAELGKVTIISTSSPIGAKLSGKKSGETAELNGKKIIIKEIY